MPDITIGVNRDLRGGLDSDTDIQNLAGGNYPDCVNVERNNSGIGGADAPSDGNAIAYTIPEIQKQGQKVRVFNNLIDFQNNEYNFIRMSLYNANGFLIRNSYLDAKNYTIDLFAGIKNAVEAELATETWNEGYSTGSVTAFNNTEGYFDVFFEFEYDSYTFELVPGFGDLALVGGRIASGSSGGGVVISRDGTIGGVVRPPANNVNSGVGTPINETFTEFDPLDIKIIQEAYSASAAGKLHLIGSKENNSKLFMCWTTKTKDKTRIPIGNNVQMYINTGISGDGSNKLWVETFPIEHGLTDYQSIILANAQSPFSIYNGTWVIRVVGPTSFYLATSNNSISANLPTSPIKSFAEVYTNVDGVGAFVVQTYDVQTNTYQYKIPLRSKNLNWDTKHQIDLDVEFFNNVYSLYYNDFLNRPRVTYFNNPIETDSAIEAINPTGQYEYEKLSEQIKLQLDYGGVTLKINNQYQVGGSLVSGSYRYGVVLVTEQLTETEISDLTDQINVYVPAYEGQNEANVYGTYAATSKINEILVTGINPGIFKYIDLVAVYISGSNTTTTSTEALVVSRTQLGDDQTEIILKHSGNEIDTRGFSLGQLSPVRETILKAYNNVIGENRLLVSNFETTQRVNINDWVSTFRYSIKRNPVYWDYIYENNLGFSIPFSGYKVDGQNEYECPIGYQLYEWYRFYVVAEFIEGGFTDATFCFDVRFVTKQDYENSWDTEDDFRFISTNGSDRRNLDEDELDTYNYNPSVDIGDLESVRLYYQFGIEINNVDWDFSIDGVKVSDIFKRIKICRAERIPEVLNSGALNQSLKITQIEESNKSSYPGSEVGQYVFADYCGSIKNVNGAEASYSLQMATSIEGIPNIDVARYLYSEFYGSYYSPDLIFSAGYDFQDGDKLVIISRYVPVETLSSTLRKFESNNPFFTSYVADIEEGKGMSFDSVTQFNDLNWYTKKANDQQIYYVVPNPGSTIVSNNFEEGSIIFKFKNKIPIMGLGFNPGMYTSLYFRKKANKYGSREAALDVLYTDYSIFPYESSKTVFGGDVYTQQTWFKKMFPLSGGGGAAAFNIISQNKLNTQLRVVDITNPTNVVFPITTQNLATWLNSTVTDQFAKNYAYSVVKNQQLLPIFDENQISRSSFPSRIIYSELKPNGSVKDFYRLFPPAQFRDNPNNFGAIVHMDLKQGELFTLQELCYTREFLNSTGQLSTIDSGQVIIGDASVLSRPGVRLTSLGSKHKWSYARGLTDAGTDVRCWVNSDFFVVLRAGRDGTVNLTERSFMDTYLRDHMRFIRDKFTPADGQGIHAVWDDVGKNFVITVRGWKDNVPWSANALGYNIGEIVSYGEQYSIPILYICIQSLAPPSQQGGTRPDPNPLVREAIPGSEIGSAYWRKIDFSDINYYSLFTICFNEARNRFTHFNTFYPKIYATHFDRYFSPKPHTDESNKFYLMRQGEALVFYDEEHEGYTEYVINQEPSMLKKFVSIAYNAILKPLRVEFKTQFISEQGIEERVTTLDRSEFKIRENIVYSTIKNTLDENGQNNQRTAPMKGLWLRIKTFFKARENQKINDIFVPIRMGQRNVKNP